MSSHAICFRTSVRPRLLKSHRPALRLDSLEDRTVPTAVALLGADDPSWVDDVRAKLLATGQFTSVDEVDVMFSTPTLAQLESYDSVLVWSDFGFADPNALGDTLADYVDAGHGVVTSTFANTFYVPLGGRWTSGGYDPIVPDDVTAFTPLTLGAVAQPAHPIMAGVTNFSGGNASWHTIGALNAGTSLVASWSDGLPLVAERSGTDVGLNMFPPSSDVYFDGWDSGTQGGLLMANALSYVAGFGARAVFPAAGEVVSTPSTDFVVGFNAAYDPATVAASDLTVNGIPATSVTLTDATTLTFHFAASPVTAQGLQAIHMADGAVASLDGGDGVRELNSSFRYDAVLLQVASTAPAAGSTVLLPFTTLDLNFNEPFDPASAQTSDFAVNQGSVAAVTPVDADTLRLTLSGVIAEGTLNVSMPAGSMTDVYGNQGAAFAASYTLDFGTFPFPTPLTPQSPAGSLIYSGSQAGIIGPAGDTDTFSVLVDPGQKITITVDPAGGLQPVVDLYRGGSLVGTAIAAASGQEAVLQTVPTTGQIGAMGPGPQTYLVVVRGARGTTGAYAVRFLLGAAVENESHGGATDDTPATAQSLESSFLSFNAAVGSNQSGSYPGRGAVLGSLAPAPILTAPGAFANQETFSGNAYPFAIAPFGIPSMRYQQIYSAAEFNTGGVIDQLRFRRSTFSGPFDNIDMDVQIRIGYAARSVDTASADFADNVGTGSTVVYDGPLHLSSTGSGFPNPFDITIDVANAFNYDPSQGDLLVDFFIRTSSAPFASFFEATPFGAQDSTTRVFSFDVNDPSGNVGFFGSDTRPYGLVTQFAFVPPDRQDVYKLNLQAGESASLALKTSAPGASVTLLNAAGATVATGVGTANADGMITDYLAPAGGTYYARVGGTNTAGTDYSLVVTRNVSFNAEPNNTPATAQNLAGPQVAGQQWALGYAAGGVALLDMSGTPVTGAGTLTGDKIKLGIQSDGSFIVGPTGIQFLGNEFVQEGTPLAGFTISRDGLDFTNKGAIGITDIPVTLELLSSGSFQGVKATGIVGGNLRLERVVAFKDGDEFATIATRLTNVGGTPLANVAWLENLDPDQGQPATGSFATSNDVVFGGELVRGSAATPAFPGGLTIGLGSADARRVVSAEGFNNNDPFEIINSPLDPDGAVDDIAINMAFNYGTLAPGAAVSSVGVMTFGRTPAEADVTYAAHRAGTVLVDPDVYKVSASAQSMLAVQTMTPAGKTGQFVNDLDPIVRIYNAAGMLVASDDNSAPDGKNAKVSYKVPKGAGGIYYIEVGATTATPKPTAGEYILTVKGASASPAGSPLRVAAAPAAQSAKKLTVAAARSLLGTAERLWRRAGFDTSLLGKLDIRVTDLGGTTLGMSSARTIWLDDNAAGWGWFVDHTPGNDSEFRAGSPAVLGRIDLLTVLVHEVGHLLGLDHAVDGAMMDTLGTGVRRKPGGTIG